MSLAKSALLICLAAMASVVMGASAQDWTQKSVTEPGAFWNIWGAAKANFVAVPDLKGGAAQRVTVMKPTHPWDAGTYAAIAKPVHKGDTLVLMFDARAETPPAGSDLIMVTGCIYEAAASGAAVTPDTTFLLGRQWKRYTAIGKAVRDYPPGTLSAGMKLGTGDQTIDFGPIWVLDFGPDFDPNMLPHE